MFYFQSRLLFQYYIWLLYFRTFVVSLCNFTLLVTNDYFEDVTMLMDGTSLPVRYHWYIEPVGGAEESPGWRKIECFLLAPQSLAGVEAAHSQLHGPPTAKSDLVQGNIFSLRPCLQFRRPGHMLWNEAGRQTKRVVICPHCVAIDLLLLAGGFLEGTVSSKERKKEEKKRLHAPSEERFPRPDLPWGSTGRIWHHQGLNKWSANTQVMT